MRQGPHFAVGSLPALLARSRCWYARAGAPWADGCVLSCRRASAARLPSPGDGLHAPPERRRRRGGQVRLAAAGPVRRAARRPRGVSGGGGGGAPARGRRQAPSCAQQLGPESDGHASQATAAWLRPFVVCGCGHVWRDDTPSAGGAHRPGFCSSGPALPSPDLGRAGRHQRRRTRLDARDRPRASRLRSGSRHGGCKSRLRCPSQRRISRACSASLRVVACRWSSPTQTS